jgi:hypothetical protein
MDTDNLRQVEAVVLARAIELHPKPLSVAALIAEMDEVAPGNPNHAAESKEAIEGLASVGLLVGVADEIEPTPAGLRSGELELGL